MFTVLVGRPGIGKGAALNVAFGLLKKANTANILSDRLTIEYVLEKLSKGFSSPSLMATGGIQIGTDSSAAIFSPELSIFITASQVTLPILADLWDAREQPFSYGTRHKGEYTIAAPCVTLMGGSTQEWLIDSIPSNAVGGGFTRRVNFVFAKDKEQFIPWPAMNGAPLHDTLVEDLRHISAHLRGEFVFSPEARPIFEKHYCSAVPNEFDDDATTAFKTSQWAHAVKLAMCISAARADDRIITKADYEMAIHKVAEVTSNIPIVFRAVGESDLVTAADRVLKFLEKKGYATYQEILRANWRHVSIEDLNVILATFKEGGLVLEQMRGNKAIYQAIQPTKP